MLCAPCSCALAIVDEVICIAPSRPWAKASYDLALWMIHSAKLLAARSCLSSYFGNHG
jgi:hypothetical protein